MDYKSIDVSKNFYSSDKQKSSIGSFETALNYSEGGLDYIESEMSDDDLPYFNAFKTLYMNYENKDLSSEDKARFEQSKSMLKQKFKTDDIGKIGYMLYGKTSDGRDLKRKGYTLSKDGGTLNVSIDDREEDSDGKLRPNNLKAMLDSTKIKLIDSAIKNGGVSVINYINKEKSDNAYAKSDTYNTIGLASLGGSVVATAIGLTGVGAPLALVSGIGFSLGTAMSIYGNHFNPDISAISEITSDVLQVLPFVSSGKLLEAGSKIFGNKVLGQIASHSATGASVGGMLYLSNVANGREDFSFSKLAENLGIGGVIGGGVKGAELYNASTLRNSKSAMKKTEDAWRKSHPKEMEILDNAKEFIAGVYGNGDFHSGLKEVGIHLKNRNDVYRKFFASKINANNDLGDNSISFAEKLNELQKDSVNDAFEKWISKKKNLLNKFNTANNALQSGGFSHQYANKMVGDLAWSEFWDNSLNYLSGNKHRAVGEEGVDKASKTYEDDVDRGIWDIKNIADVISASTDDSNAIQRFNEQIKLFTDRFSGKVQGILKANILHRAQHDSEATLIENISSKLNRLKTNNEVTKAGSKMLAEILKDSGYKFADEKKAPNPPINPSFLDIISEIANESKDKEEFAKNFDEHAIGKILRSLNSNTRGFESAFGWNTNEMYGQAKNRIKNSGNVDVTSKYSRNQDNLKGMFFVNDWGVFERLYDAHNSEEYAKVKKYLPFEMRGTDYKMLMTRTIADSVKNANIFHNLTKDVNVHTLFPKEKFQEKYISKNEESGDITFNREKFEEDFNNIRNGYSTGREIKKFYNGELEKLDENGLYNLMAIKKYSYIPEEPYSADSLNKMSVEDIYLNSASEDVLNLDLISNRIFSVDYDELTIAEKQGIQDVWLSRSGIDDYGLNNLRKSVNTIGGITQLATLSGSAVRNLVTGTFEGVVYGGKALSKWVSSPSVRKITKSGVISDAFNEFRLRDAKHGNKEIYNSLGKKAMKTANHIMDTAFMLGDITARTGKLIDVMYTLSNPGKNNENLYNLISKHSFGDQLDVTLKLGHLSKSMKDDGFNLKEYLKTSPNTKEYLQSMIDDANFSFTSLGEATSILLKHNANNPVSKTFYSLINTFLRYSISLASKYVSSAYKQMQMTKENPFNLSIGPLLPFILMQAGKGVIDEFMKDLKNESFADVYKKYNDNLSDIFNKNIIAQLGEEPSSWIMKGNKTFMASRIQYFWQTIHKISSDDKLSAAEKTNLIGGIFFQPWGVYYMQTHGLNTGNYKKSKNPKKEKKSISLD